MLTAPKIKLTTAESENNKKLAQYYLKDIFEQADFKGIAAHIQGSLLNFTLSYCETYLIQLEHLLEVERHILIDALKMFALSINSDSNQKISKSLHQQMTQELDTWKNDLKHAIPNDKLNKLHGNKRNLSLAAFMHQLILGDNVALEKEMPSLFSKLGTDLDIKHFLGDVITDAKEIKSPGKYIINPCALLTPSSSHETSSNLDDTLKLILSNLKSTKGKVELYIPVNLRNSHWCLLAITIENQKVTTSRLRDSMDGTSQSVQLGKLEADKIVASVNGPLQEVLCEINGMDIQKNCHSCMDYVIQDALRFMGNNHSDSVKHSEPHQAVVEAANASELRKAILEKVIHDDEVLKRSDLLSEIEDYSNKVASKEESHESKNVASAWLKSIPQKKNWDEVIKKQDEKHDELLKQGDSEIDRFDEEFAKNLKKAFDYADKTTFFKSDGSAEAVDEKVLEYAAFEKTLEEYSNTKFNK